MKKEQHQDRKSFSKWSLACLPPIKSQRRDLIRFMTGYFKRKKPLLPKDSLRFFPRYLLSRSKYGIKVPSKARIIWEHGTHIGKFNKI